MDKEQAKVKADAAVVKAKVAMAEIKANFKPDEGATGAKKIQSMFVNLWKSGTAGKGTLVAAAVVVLLLLPSIFGGGENGKQIAVYEAIPADLAVKGIAIRMSGDAALEACNKLVAAEKDLSVLDYRKGIVREKDDETKATDKKYWEGCLRRAAADIERFLKWNSVKGETYQPGASFCAVPSPETQKSLLEGGPLTGCSQLYVQWRDEKKATIPGPNYTVATAMAALAGIYGYQVEWMLPGQRPNQKAANNRPELVAVEVLKGSEFVGLGGVGAMSRWLKGRESGWEGREFNKRLYPNVYNKGLMIHRECESSVICRLVPQDETGKPVKTDDLATELAANYTERYEKAGSKAEMVKMAEKDVEKLKNGVGNESPYAGMMFKLAENCKVSVEWFVGTEPVPKYEEITETFVIPDNTQQGACKYIHDMDSLRLGKYSDSTSGNDGSRKRYFFKKDLVDVGSPVWFRLVLKDKDGKNVSKEEVVQNWLTARGHYKPSDTVKIPPKNVIKIVIDKKGVSVDKLTGICYLWLDDAGKVKETYFTEEGMARLFDARDLTGEKFADLLVKSYPGLPNLTLNVETTDPGRGKVQDNIWTYESPNGYRVKLFERTYINKNGVRYDDGMIEKDVEVAAALSLAGLLPTKHLSIIATKPDAARKFD